MMDPVILKKVVELHDADCADRTCEPAHFAKKYLNGWFKDQRDQWVFYKDGVKKTAEVSI